MSFETGQSAFAGVVAVATRVGAALLHASWQGALYLIVVIAACRAFPRIPASARCCLWWLACLKLLIGLFWVTPIDIMVPQPVSAPTWAVRAADICHDALVHPAAETRHAFGRSHARRSAPAHARTVSARHRKEEYPFLALFAALWLVGALYRLWKIAGQYTAAAALSVGGETAERGGSAASITRQMSRRMGVASVPRVVFSARVATPLVVGLWRPTILLPALRPLDPGQDDQALRLALAHEMAHVRRQDLLFGLIPSAANAVFFFHPLAWTACREYAIAREEACDAEAIRVTGTSPQAYGRLLLQFGVAGRSIGAGFASAGVVASGTARALKRRLETLGRPARLSRRSAAVVIVLAVVAGAAGLAPVRVVARPARRHAGAGKHFAASDALLRHTGAASRSAMPVIVPARRVGLNAEAVPADGDQARDEDSRQDRNALARADSVARRAATLTAADRQSSIAYAEEQRSEARRELDGLLEAQRRGDPNVDLGDIKAERDQVRGMTRALALLQRSGGPRVRREEDGGERSE